MGSRAMLCECCHRIQGEPADRQAYGAGHDAERCVQRNEIDLQDLSLYDGLCPECEGFYRQLIAYGRPPDEPWRRRTSNAHP